MAKVAFIGLGVMGFPMAGHLAAGGHDVTVYNRNPARAAAWTIDEVPIATITFVDRDRQWMKSQFGLDLFETPRDVSFCGHAILQDDIMVVRDVNQDERFIDNPLVTGEPYIRFYAGAPLKLPNGHNVGTLCLIDSKPRTLDDIDLAILGSLRDLAVEELVRREHGDAAP